MKCNICGKEMRLLDCLKNHESEVTKVYRQPNCSKSVEINFYQCPACTHGRIGNMIQKDYYQEYELIHNVADTGVTGAYTQTLMEYYDRQFAELHQYARGTEYILDIGCGPGILLERAMKYFEKGIGVEPSRIQSKYAEENLNIKMINTFFDKEVDIPDNSIDAFICTQVFEHLENALEVAEIAFQKLKKNGIGYIEVPNGQQIINEDHYYDIFPEHVNYYTVLSLTTLLVRAGFEIVKIGEAFGGSFLAAYVRKGETYTGFVKKRSDHQKSMEHIASRYANIAVWGAGTKARSFISLMKANPPKYIFDSNPLLQGGYLCNSDVKIENPDLDKINECEAIIIFAVSYKKEIEQILREKYKFKGQIIAMDEMMELE